MKYKVGDRVRIRKDLVAGKYYGGTETNGRGEMNKYFGKVARITKKGLEDYRIDIDNGAWFWSDEMLELSIIKTMKLSKLAKKLLDRDVRILIKKGVLDGDLQVTDEGMQKICEMLILERKADIVKFVSKKK